MSSMESKRSWSPLQSLLAAAFTLALASGALGQTPAQGKAPPNAGEGLSNPAKKDSDPRFGTVESEMRTKAILKDEKKRYEENLDRAREVSELAAQLSESYTAHQSFVSDDNKKLERLEKLAKRIRNEAGGSDSDPDADLKDICATPTETVKHLAEMAEELHKMVDKTPRQVVSAGVIDQANRVISVTQHLRSSH